MKYKLVSLGCKVNSYENNAVASLLNDRGYFLSKDDDADIIIINTCSVTATADQKSRQYIRRYRKKYPQAIIVVMGCYSQKRHEYIFKELGADIVLGTSKRKDIPSLIDDYLKSREKVDVTEEDPRKYLYEELGCSGYSENIRAYLKIQDGCDNFCTYCLIPLVRGRSRSRHKDDIIQEAQKMIENGYQEIVLTGVDVSSYGKDLENETLASLINELSTLDGLKSLRISSIEESLISDELISLIASRDNIAKHLHLSLQSGSKAVLHRMNRKYTPKEFLLTCKKLRSAIPDIALTTDVIVGFPGETEEEFMESVDFIKQCDFNMLHVFPYSPREKTAAKLMKNQVDEKIKKERVNRLIELSDNLWDKFTDKYLNKEVEVLIEEYNPLTKINRGHTSNYIEVEIESDHSLVGKYVKTIYKK